METSSIRGERARRGDDRDGGYFTSDRAAKYGWGVPRLALVTLFAFEIVPRAFLAGSRAPVDALVSTPLPFTAEAAAAPFAPLTLVPYLQSLRWIAHAYTGSIGAGVNVQVLGLLGNLAIMAVAGGLCLWDLTKDISLVVYFLKTFCGDQLAGKLDTAEWKLVLAFTFALPLALWGAAGANGAAFGMFLPYARIAHRALCHSSRMRVRRRAPRVPPRHRQVLPPQVRLRGVHPLRADDDARRHHRPELRVVQFDLVICLFYRVANLAIILHKQGFVAAVAASLAVTIRKGCFRVFGALSGQRIVNVTDAEVATAVMRSSDVKGDALERHVATPAWRPLLSLESVDHELYGNMLRGTFTRSSRRARRRRGSGKSPGRKSTSSCTGRTRKRRRRRRCREEASRRIRRCRRPRRRRRRRGQASRRRHARRLPHPHGGKGGDVGKCPFMQMQRTIGGGASGESNTAGRSTPVSGASPVIDADDVARLSLSVFIEYLFGREWEPKFETLLAASWEWRKEIAVRGRADPGVKKAAVELVVDDLIKNSHLWDLFGEKWREPRYYSLIMQPFLVSPAINVGDIAVAMKAHPDLALEPAMRRMHPFPIFERWVDKDVVVKGRIAVRANTQVIMFTSDFANSKHLWPAFGTGPRACAGTSMALGVLNAIHQKMLGRPGFDPERGHRFSGRNNDGVTSLAEVWYFAKTVLPVVFGFGGEKTTEAAALERARPRRSSRSRSSNTYHTYHRAIVLRSIIMEAVNLRRRPSLKSYVHDIHIHVATRRSELAYCSRHTRQLIAVEENMPQDVSCPISAGTLVS